MKTATMESRTEETTTTAEIVSSKPLDNVSLLTCENCGNLYHWFKSSSTLRSRFDSFLCERAVEGFTIEALTKADIVRKPKTSGDL